MMHNKKLADNKLRGIAIFFNKNSLLSDIVIMILCCIAGLLVKKMINPFANMITDALHVPGGISTAFSLMFLVIASGITVRKWNASIMGSMQALAALSIGMVGSMGILMPLAYLIPGVVVDLVMLIPEKKIFSVGTKAFLANIISSVSAALFADIIVFHLPIKPLTVYLLLAAVSGAICGFMAGVVIEAVEKAKNNQNEK